MMAPGFFLYLYAFGLLLGLYLGLLHAIWPPWWWWVWGVVGVASCWWVRRRQAQRLGGGW